MAYESGQTQIIKVSHFPFYIQQMFRLARLSNISVAEYTMIQILTDRFLFIDKHYYCTPLTAASCHCENRKRFANSVTWRSYCFTFPLSWIWKNGKVLISAKKKIFSKTVFFRCFEGPRTRFSRFQGGSLLICTLYAVPCILYPKFVPTITWVNLYRFWWNKNQMCVLARNRLVL